MMVAIVGEEHELLRRKAAALDWLEQQVFQTDITLDVLEGLFSVQRIPRGIWEGKTLLDAIEAAMYER